MIRITARREGFRRCGVEHSLTTIEYDDSEFTDEQLEMLRAEPMLVVEVTEDRSQKTEARNRKAENGNQKKDEVGE
jgi:hypothetical protein